jgi:hypothetical protein
MAEGAAEDPWVPKTPVDPLEHNARGNRVRAR